MGSPYINGANYRLTYFPFYYIEDEQDMKTFRPSNSRNFENAFNFMTVIKCDGTHKRAYYSYLDEVQNLCNTLMDYIVYNDRRVFASMASAFLGIDINRLTCTSFANPRYFPLT